ncbi:NAD(P)/FAD-dependent oxidoreductase [Sinosporangium siamense]|uniref:FAD-dependent oxidoreductase n=1 Tax=Sinosporangium siamense TaxID=1367973 RepID=A0A919V9D3_9ACTN|nr:FAD-binding oxidoreductase [Sinosporangium siamense]GII95176.1 FAD-dependent oxidoreductase [Sinosporangium siamense]
MTDHQDADAIVVGAGIFGAALANHLQQAGIGRVVMLDAGEPGRGTSGSGAGFVGYWTAGYMPVPSTDDYALEDYGVRFYRSLSERGKPIDYRGNGSLFVATSEAGAPRVAKMADHPLAPAGTRALDPLETAKVTGHLLSADAVTTAVLHPGGIQISAGRATRALAALAGAEGVEIRSGAPVNRLLADDRGVRGVRTPAGDLRSRTVILACGAWTNELLRPLQAAVPIARVIASRVVSPPSGVAESSPTVMVPEWNGLWLREHRGGITWGNPDGYAPLSAYADRIAVGDHPRVEELVDAMSAALGPRLDVLLNGRDRSVAAWTQGVPCYTPDGRFIAGPVPEVPGLHVMAGDNEAGVTHGPGLARMVADLVAGNAVDYVDPSVYAVDRFERRDMTEDEILNAAPEYE